METSKEGSGQKRKKEGEKENFGEFTLFRKSGGGEGFLYKTGKAMAEKELKTSVSADCRAMQLPLPLSRYLARQTFFAG